MIVLGIDPGFQFSGFGIIEKKNNPAVAGGYGGHGKIVLLECGYLKLNPTKHLSVRVHEFYDHFDAKIKKYNVTDIALETSFLGKNAQNFLKLGYLRGILYLLASQHKLNLHEFSPCEIKQSITGFGGAQKDQVARVVLQLFPGLLMPAKNDVTDAIAVSLCGAWQNKSLF